MITENNYLAEQIQEWSQKIIIWQNRSKNGHRKQLFGRTDLRMITENNYLAEQI